MRRIVVCADDYALAPGVSKAIRTLIARGRINATSVMVIFPGLATEATALAMTETPLRLELGLHVTLTGPYRPLVATPLRTADGDFPPPANLLEPFARWRIDRGAVEAEIAAQIRLFVETFKRPPDYVDGHHHVQLMPGIRDPLLATVARDAPGAWVRQCGPADWRKLRIGDAKTAMLAALSAGFRRAARRAGVRFNPAFAGAYDYGTAGDFAQLFARFLDGLPDGGVIMCHPGFADDALMARDRLTQPREAEYAFLSGDQYPQLLARAGVTLA
jgi:predicted glycoside hydrolase/deacetylase ChbG (UPF0249 family)